MKRNHLPLILTLLFVVVFLFAGDARSESINVLQKDLNSNQITTGGAASSSGCTDAAGKIGSSIKSAAESISQSCNQIKSSCSGFFSKLKSFFQDLFSMFKQIIKQFVDAFKGCTGNTTGVSDNNGCNQNTSNNADDGASNSSSNNETSNSNSNDNSNTNGSNQTPPANNDQGAATERPAGEAAGVDTSNAQSLIKALKEKFNITVENGSSQWSLSQLKQTYELLTKLPPSFTANTKMIQRIASTSLGANVGGYVSSGAPRVYLTNHGTSSMTFVLVHEMAHCFHFAQSGVFSKWQSQFWGGRNGYSGSGNQVSSSVSSYGNSNSMEDFAESVRAYYMNGASMKRTHPDRYEFVKQYVMAGVEY
ncbi:MAG: hypothetical protein A2008_03985 [Candidatus Wallbacteria bacterium GWC2_49_35]|uniref:DUF4157 domain-containing protein n=1 Tax=Candidatus Wallbacteria bacterium GWC2_49_35 TaxID=1817813 RepID=A0A1F7WUK1_9BACT|nr:MAG: hypothetical protein A2008_03985 [Candidatus Wallbacteria bacterium GWC2_49_35]HBC75809.1 hypothetical protein [Candidatus Wallbacteria bacterium]